MDTQKLIRLTDDLDYYQSLERHFMDATERKAFNIDRIDFSFWGSGRMIPKEYRMLLRVTSDRKIVKDLGDIIFDYFEKEILEIVKNLKNEIRKTTEQND